jgi:hypothetical protein
MSRMLAIGVAVSACCGDEMSRVLAIGLVIASRAGDDAMWCGNEQRCGRPRMRSR